MATGSVPTWSTTASTNATADPAVNFAEGMAPSQVNDSARALMASVAKWRNDLYGITTGGTSTAYTVTTGATFASAADMSGAVFCIVPHATSGASPTLAVDSLTARAINVSTGVAVPTGALISGTPYLVKYVHASTEFIVLGTLGKYLLTALDIVNGTALTAPASDDSLAIYDLSATANKRILISDFFKVLTLLTAETSPATDDELALYDTSASTTDKITLANLLKVINGLTEDTSPDNVADFVPSYDTSGSGPKKVAPFRFGAFGSQLLHVREEQTANTAGGTFTSGAWRTRTLNTTVTNEISGASLASNQITLPSGTYWIDARAPASLVNGHKAKLANITDTADTVLGSTEFGSNANNSVTTSSVIRGRFTIAAQKVFEIQHRSTASGTFGLAANVGVTEVYTDVQIWKIA